MPTFKEHLLQLKSNWSALQVMLSTEFFDWQIVICFYTAYHFVQAHFSKSGIHHSTHQDVKATIRPSDKKSKTRLASEILTAYEELEVLSRRARYLFDGRNPNKNIASPVEKIDVVEAIHHLNTIAVHFSKKYHLYFEKIRITDPELALELKKSLDYFEVVRL